jgi:hypothetical protein
VAFVLEIHGLVRWLVALIAIVAIVKFAMGWLRNMPFTSADQGIMSAYTGLMDLNLLLGLILLFGLGGGFPMHRIEHATTMIIAVVVAHLSAIWKKSDDSAKKFRNYLIVVVVSIVLIVMAVIRLRGGWTFA